MQKIPLTILELGLTESLHPLFGSMELGPLGAEEAAKAGSGFQRASKIPKEGVSSFVLYIIS